MPRIHAASRDHNLLQTLASGEAAWIAGSSPAMTNENKKAPQESCGAFEVREETEEEIRPWQAWQRPTLPSLET
jgi:hypothetical protein